MRFIKLNSQQEADAINVRVTKSCIDAGVWGSGTDNYCNPQHEEFWLVPVLDGYDQFFTPAELAGIDDDHQLLLDDIEKGKRVIQMYLLDSRKLDITTQQSLTQLQKFSAIKSLLEVGAIGPAMDLLIGTQPDEIFTEDRKDKYLSALKIKK